MKKMEEIMELLTEEIEGFNRSIKKLENLSKNLQNLKVKADSSSIKYLLKEHLKDERRSLERYKDVIKEMDKKLKAARLTPDWLAAFFCIAVVVSVLSISYFGHHFIQFKDWEKEVFVEGKKEAFSELRGYFDDHPIIYKDFQKWARKQDSIPDKK